MKLKPPYCNFCNRKLERVTVDGSETGEPELDGIEFDVSLSKKGIKATTDILNTDRLDKTSNPIRLLAEVEVFVETKANEVKCPHCSKKVELVRILPPPPPDPNAPQQGQLNAPQNPMQLIQQLMQGAQQNLGTNAPITFAPPSGGQGNSPNYAAIEAMFDSKFTDAELADILVDVGDMPPGVTMPKKDMLDRLLYLLYN